MSERKSEAIAVLVDYVCDVCNTGVMLREGNIVLTSHPPLFPHKCSHCGHIENFHSKYPDVRFERGEVNK